MGPAPCVIPAIAADAAVGSVRVRLFPPPRYDALAPLLLHQHNMAVFGAAEVKHGTDGAPVLVSAETLTRWFRHYQQDGLQALENRPRSDRRRCRDRDPDTVDQLLALADREPTWTVKALYRQLQRDLGRALPLKPVAVAAELERPCRPWEHLAAAVSRSSRTRSSAAPHTNSGRWPEGT